MESEWPFKSHPVFDECHLQFLSELRKEVCSPVDDPDKVLDIMDSYGFHKLSESSKLHILHYFSGSSRMDRLFNWSIWDEVMYRDKINTMVALLPHTPLFGIDRNNIPCKCLSWMSSSICLREGWIRDTLYENKLRWKPGSCQCTNHHDPANKMEKICSLTKIAFTMFAAELCCHNVTYSPDSLRCTAYLLVLAPDLIHIEVPRTENHILFTCAIAKCKDNMPNNDILLTSGAHKCGSHIGMILKTIRHSNFWIFFS